jgi:hypothetical protein
MKQGRKREHKKISQVYRAKRTIKMNNLRWVDRSHRKEQHTFLFTIVRWRRNTHWFRTAHLPTSIKSRSAVYRTLSTTRPSTWKVMNKMRVEPRRPIYAMNLANSWLWECMDADYELFIFHTHTHQHMDRDLHYKEDDIYVIQEFLRRVQNYIKRKL